MNTFLRKSSFILIVMVALLVSCKVTQPYNRPLVKVENKYRGQITDDTASLADLSYKSVFLDTVLQNLISEGLSNNLEIAVAYTRMEQVQAYYENSKAAFLPNINANTGLTQSKLSDVQGFGIRTHLTQYQLGVSSTWEADVWGRLKSNKSSNLAALLQSQATIKAIKTRIVGTIANNYFLLLALDKQIAITEETIRNWDSTITTLKRLKESAVVTEAAVVQSEAQRYAAEVTLPDLKQRIREIENMLSIVIGRPASSIERSNLENQETVTILKTGIPAQLLANRPDVQGAELQYRRSFELTNIARTAFYPSLTITGNSGFSSLTLGNFFNPTSLAANIGLGLTQPVFNRRINQSNLIIAKADQQAALIGMQNTFLIAGQEVSDALYLYATAMYKSNVRKSQLNALEKSVGYTEELLNNGFANYTEVITARQSFLGAQLGSINDKLQQLQATVNLYRALGGGWR